MLIDTALIQLKILKFNDSIGFGALSQELELEYVFQIIHI